MQLPVSFAQFAASLHVQRRGVSPIGAWQLLHSQIVTDSNDRMAIAKMIHAEKNQDIEVENDETHWVGHDRKGIGHVPVPSIRSGRTETVDNNESITIGASATESLRRTGLSMIGAIQCLTAQPITAADDREKLAMMIVKRFGNLTPSW